MGNPLIEIMKEGIKHKWCMSINCTTCGSLDYRRKVQELAGSLGGPLSNALEDLDINELTSLSKWQEGLVIAVLDLPMPMQRDSALKAWLPNLAGHPRFADYILFRLVRYLSSESETRRKWISKCISMAVENSDSSLIESLLLVLRKEAIQHPDLITVASSMAKTSQQIRRVLFNVCNLKVEKA